MIVSRRADGLVLVRQVDHQDQCALMARAWGNDIFSRPEPYAPLETAAALHDEGWRTWEQAPRVAEGAPVNFTAIDRETHVALYAAGIGAVVASDTRAGLLVSMHGQGLYEGRGGLDAEPAPPREERPAAVRDFLAEQDAVQARLRGRIGAGDALTQWARACYRLLQTWDSLSLYLVWRGLSEGGRGTLPKVPRDEWDAEGVTLAIAPAGPDTCTITPWPFADDVVELPVPARVIEDRPYADDADLGASLERAGWTTLVLRARRPEDEG